jgi:hypothetical protein
VLAANVFHYQQQIIQKQKNIFSQNNPTLWKNTFTEFPKKDIEEATTTTVTVACCYSEYPPICYYCDYKPDSKDDYERQ